MRHSCPKSRPASWIGSKQMYGSTQLISETHRIDVVLSNVSIISRSNNTLAWNAAFNVGIMGAVTLIEKSLPFLEESGGGGIVTISTVSSRDIDFTAPSPYGAF
jgi:3-oxoacyl-[acyl-carrier protein] reductase